ncbi:MAG: coproporphyrinogen-III oxidase family protein [Nanoarchaeota archaeon]
MPETTDKPRTLSQKAAEYEFHPEIYAYPTPRMYGPLVNDLLPEPDFGQDIGVYIHIPFCKQICSYCGYLKILDRSEELKEDYVSALTKEIAQYRPILESKTIKTLCFGGGTPTRLTNSQIKRILDAIIETNPDSLKTSQEVSMEATPESILDPSTIHELHEMGFNRISLGIQSLDPAEIRLCGRKNDPLLSIAAIKTLKETGIQNIVADLMIGIEGQTALSFQRSAQTLADLRPDTVELYALGVNPNTRIGRAIGSATMSNQDTYTCYDIGRSIFLQAGYKQDCHNRYALPGRGSFLQEDHVFEGKGLIGLGAGARSYAKNIHYRNISKADGGSAIAGYIMMINLGTSTRETGIVLDEEERMRQHAIYNIEHLDKNTFQRLSGRPFEETFPKFYQELMKSGLANDDGHEIRLTTRGLNFRDLIGRELFSDKANQAESSYRPVRP